MRRTTVQPTLPLDLRGSSGLGPAPRIPDLRFVDEDGFGHVATPSRDLPPVPAWGARILLVVAEVLERRRPPEQLARCATHDVLLDLRATARGPRREVPQLRSRGRRVRTLRWSEPADGVVELTTVLDGGERPLVLCARFEGYDGRWLCVSIGSPDGWLAGPPPHRDGPLSSGPPTWNSAAAA